tara:strand:+ start:1741 stop:1953 length:213 start_codon:yes stop_codon:yes gene_type:complete
MTTANNNQIKIDLADPRQRLAEIREVCAGLWGFYCQSEPRSEVRRFLLEKYREANTLRSECKAEIRNLEA